MFNNSPCSTSFGDTNNINYCAPLKRLMNEHPPLLAKMADFNKMIQQFENDEKENWKDAVLQLHEKIKIFIAELEPHSDREEEVLFEMMAKYIGREGGPIGVMEYEHNIAKLNLKQFMDKVGQLNEQNQVVSKELAINLFRHLKIVYITLTDHFMKEKKILFPMAEQMLSDEEKKQLEEEFNKRP